MDPRCQQIYSIDPRPEIVPDERGSCHYPADSKQIMLNGLNSIAPHRLSILKCFDNESAQVEPTLITSPPDFCFIDGEHTVSAVLADFDFCLSVINQSAVVAFHDDWIVWPAISEIIKKLDATGIHFQALSLAGSTFALFINFSEAASHDLVSRLSSDGRKALRRLPFYSRIKRNIPTFVRHLFPVSFGRFLRKIVCS